MSNETLRKRLGIADSNYPMVSRLIAEAVEGGWIKPYGDTRGKYMFLFEFSVLA
jgi:hypothetical protein